MADFNNIDNFVNAFISNGSPYFVLAIGVDVKARNPKSDITFENIEEAAQFLEAHLKGYEDHEDKHKHLFKLYILDEKPKAKPTFDTAKKIADITISFQFTKSAEYYQNKPTYVNPASAEILAELKALRMKVEEIEDSEEEEEPNNPFIGALTSNPAIMNNIVTAAVSAISSILTSFTPKPQPMQQNINPAIAGVDTEPTEQEKINKAIEVLSKSDKDLGNHLLILAKMSIDNPTQFHWLLNMLK
jgi:hypothetical protein